MTLLNCIEIPESYKLLFQKSLQITHLTRNQIEPVDEAIVADGCHENQAWWDIGMELIRKNKVSIKADGLRLPF